MQSINPAISEDAQWYVLRDLKRSNSKTPAYKVLPELGFEVFTPKHWVLKEASNGKKTREHVPIIPSLLFARSTRLELDAVVNKIDTLQYQFVKGAPQNTAMTVPAADMNRFIRVVTNTSECSYYSPDEIRPEMIGMEIMINGGPLDGSVGRLLKVRGSKKKRLIVELKGILLAAVEVDPEYIQLI